MIFDDSTFDALRTDQTATFVLYELAPRGRKALALKVVYMGDSNEAYQAARKNLVLRRLEGDAFDAAHDQLLAQHVVKGWENALQIDGTEKPFSVKGVLELFGQLRRVQRPDLIDRITLFASTPTNFVSPMADPTELGNG